MALNGGSTMSAPTSARGGKAETANIARQIEEAKQDQAQPLPEVYAERKRNAALRREALLDLQYAEAVEVLQHQITRCEAQGDFAQAKLLRVQLTNLRADLEKRFPA